MHGAVVWLALALSVPAQADAIGRPKAVDPRLKIELFAAEPDIVTPIGIAVDAKGRVLAVESHTHFRPAGYQGPPADRIRMFEDADGDGRAERISTFFEGTTWTMNLGLHPDGSLYVATRGEIFRLRDTDGDGRADERTPIVHLETAGDYPHNGLSGFAFDFDGTVYFGLGENKGAEFKLIGSDGSIVSELEGGQIYRCRADGSRLELVAFGFWNPFHLALDAFGRLFAVDNDPDSLPPCRLMHIVPGGNYGYRYRNGRKGVHPFTAWNGELPGTLPMVAGTGEAPSGVVAYESDQLPGDYVGDLLATSWGDHRIERFHLEPRGASFSSTGVAIVRGDENFRPVGIALAPDGSLFVSDWVLKSYEVHGKGRIWHITAAENTHSTPPRDSVEAIHSAHRPLREEAARRLAADPRQGHARLEKLATEEPSPRVRALAVAALASVNKFQAIERVAAADPVPGVRAAAVRSLGDASASKQLLGVDLPAEARAEALRKVTDQAYADLLWKAASDSDAFIAEAARVGLARSRIVNPITATRSNPLERLAALLILRETHNPSGRAALPFFLADADSSVRFAAIQWVGEERLTEFRLGLTHALAAGPATGRLFGGYLAALERLDGVVRTADDEWAGEQYIVRALEDSRTAPEVRRWALRMLRPDHPLLSIERLRQFIASGDPLLQMEAVRTLRDCRQDGRAAVLLQIAGNSQYPVGLRAEAVVGLSGDDPRARSLLVSLAASGDPALRNEALRSLRGCRLDDDARRQLAQIAKTEPQSAELVDRVLEPGAARPRPDASDTKAWLTLLLASDGSLQGDAAAGERIFFHSKSAGCSNCHQVTGRGARVGPELTATAGTLSQERLIESVVRPGKEIAPQFSSWLIVTTSGKSFVGMLVKEEATGEQTYADQKGDLFRFKPGEIETRTAQATSIMPDGLPQLMTLQEFRDLLAFLQLRQIAK
jgi:putative membrane-bound dehydrogenase-like protein